MVVANADTSHLIIRTISGTTAQGKAIFKNRTYNNVKVAATDDDVYAIGQAMANIQTDSVVAVERVNSNTLSQSNA